MKKIKKTAPAFMLLSLALLLGGATTKRGETILDRLERRLLEQDRDTLSFDEESRVMQRKKNKTTRYKYKPKNVQPVLPDRGQLRQISRAIAQLEREVEGLATDVRTVRQEILRDASINNMIRIDATVDDTDRATFRTLRVRVDGHLVYQLNEANGLWLPSNRIPLYEGPLTPGHHKIDFEARLMRRRQKSLPLSTDINHIVNQSFSIRIPAGEVRRAWDIAFETPDSNNYQAKARLISRKY